MTSQFLRLEEIRAILEVSRTTGYEIIREIREDFPGSTRLKPGMVRVVDFAARQSWTVEYTLDILADVRRQLSTH